MPKEQCSEFPYWILKVWFLLFLSMAIFMTNLLWSDPTSLFAQLFFILAWFGTIAPVYVWFEIR
jgi:hypothetical protein